MSEIGSSVENNSILVSVVIPTYNRAQLLCRAIRSVLRQTYTHLECIVVDDGSTDDTAQIVRQFADDRLLYLRHETNRGGSAARNTGIQNASGNYLAFLDSDDEWLPAKLEKQLQSLQSCSEHVGAVHCQFYAVFDATGDRIKVKKPLNFRGDVYQRLLQGENQSSTSLFLVRRECFKTCGLFDEELTSFQDYDMWLRIAQRYHFECVEEPLAVVHVHYGSRVSVDLMARSTGLERILSKWGPEIRRQRGENGYRDLKRHLSIAMYTNATGQHIYTGNFWSAINSLGHVIWLQPTRPKVYPWLALELMRSIGVRTFSP